VIYFFHIVSSPELKATIGEILGIWKIFLSQTNCPNALIFGMKHLGTRGYKVVQIKFLGS